MSAAGALAAGLRRTAGFALRCLVVLIVLEGAASLLGFALSLPGAIEPTLAERRHTRYDAELGWVNVPGTQIEDLYGPGASLSINAQGFRGRRDTPPRAPAGRARVVCSGDSFTLGYGVDDEQTWCARLEALDSRLEAVNMGQGGYGIDQAYLWFLRDGAPLEHRIHVFAFIRDDFGRARAGEFLGYGKPWLSLEGERLVVNNVPVPRTAYRLPWLAQNAKLFSQLRIVQLLRPGLHALSDSPETEIGMPELESVALRVFDELAQLHAAAGRRLLFVRLPQQDDYRRPDEPWLRRIRRGVRERGLEFVDLVQALDQLPPEQAAGLYIAEASVDFPWAAGHLSVAGNAWVARELLQRLRVEGGTLPLRPTEPR